MNTYDESKIVLLKGLDENRINITPEEGELLYTQDTKRLYIGDSVTPGGNLVGTYMDLDDDDIQDLILNHNHNHNELTNYILNEHINHSSIEVMAGNGLIGGGDLTENRIIHLAPPSQIHGTTTNSVQENSHTHSVLATSSRNVTDSQQLLLAKAMKDHIDTENHAGGSDGTDHNHDHNSLLNINTNQHINHTSLTITGVGALEGGGDLTESRQITLVMPGQLNSQTINSNTNNHTHAILNTDSRNESDTRYLLQAKALRDHILTEPHISASHNHDHNSLTGVIISEHVDHSLVSITSTNGIEGGGDLTTNRVFQLIMPGDISGTTINNRTGNHTHRILSTDSRNIIDDDHLLLAKALKFHLDNDPHSEGTTGGDHELDSHLGILSQPKGGIGPLTYSSGQLLIGNGITGSLDRNYLQGIHGILVTNGNGTIGITPLYGTTEHTIAQGNHNHDHDSLTNVDSNQHINHTGIQILGGSGLSGGGDITISRTLSLGQPSRLTGSTENNVSGTTHTHEILTTDERTQSDPQFILLAKAMVDHIANENHAGGSDGTDHNHDHSLLTNLITDEHINHTTVDVIGDNGLEGGGSINLSRTISLITPGVLSGTTISNRSGNHVHTILTTDERNIITDDYILLAKAMKDHIDTEPHVDITPDQLHTHTIDNENSNGFGKRYISSQPPDDSFGNEGDIWLQYDEG